MAGGALLHRLTAALSCAAVDLDLVRQQWREGSRRVEQARAEPLRHARLQRQVDLVNAELRRRVGQTFTLQELAGAYARADDWARALLEEARDDEPSPEAATATDAAFHHYARLAMDYAP